MQRSEIRGNERKYLFPRLNVDACLQEYVVGDVGHRQLGIDARAATTAQQHRDVRIEG